MTGIVIEAAPVETIPVTLVGVKYDINPPKAAFAMRIAREARKAKTGKGDDDAAGGVLDILDEWMQKAFGTVQNKAVQKRLDDEKDALDIPHIMQLMEAIIEAQSDENPTS